jgi:hypothetical protein
MVLRKVRPRKTNISYSASIPNIKNQWHKCKMGTVEMGINRRGTKRDVGRMNMIKVLHLHV